MQAHQFNFFANILCILILAPYVMMAALDSDANSDFTLNPTIPLHRVIMERAKAAEIKSYMNESADPCSDFYQFACGNYARINSADAQEVASTGLFEQLTKALNHKLMYMLNNKEEDRHDTPEDKQVKIFYESCKRLELGPNYEAKLRELISEFGAMPVLEGDAWQESHFNWLETSARVYYRYGVTAILAIEITKDIAENQINRAYIGQQDFLLESRSMYLDEQNEVYRKIYRNKIQNNLEKFLSVKSSLAKKTAQEIMDFEVELAQGLMDEKEGLDITQTTELLTVPEIHKRYAPVIDVERFFYISLGENVTDPVYEFNRRYQENLLKVIPRTNASTLANYIFYRLVSDFAEVPPESEKKRRESCIDLTKKTFAKNLDNMVYRRYVNTNETSNEIELLWHQLKATFNRTLSFSPLLNWIKPETRQLAIQKLAALTLEINSYTETDFAAELDNLQLTVDDYVENMRQTRLLSMRQVREEMHQPAKPIEDGQLLSYTPANILVENIIKVPVAILQPYQLWSEVYPNAILYGTLASLIAHEIMHTFDDMGRKFDLHGNAHDWWDEKSSENFLERQKCFTAQYARYVYNNIRLKESTSQSENIADNGGVRLAYAAYRNWYNAALANPQTLKQLAKEKLPGLNYTGNQLFFISYAQIWCSDTHSRLRQIQLATDDHVPGKFRVIGPLSNFEEFAKEFQCPSGSRMNPSKKCKIY
ncbi:neprilysin-1 [Drosophila willistoni]|nr:neprilysin-1 [Drosophila willistoni]